MALDTLYFDLKINDLTDEQIKAIRSRLEKELGQSVDIGKYVKQSIDKTDTKIKIVADTGAAEAALERLQSVISNSKGTRTEISEINALVRAYVQLSREKEKTVSKNTSENDEEVVLKNKLSTINKQIQAYERMQIASENINNLNQKNENSGVKQQIKDEDALANAIDRVEKKIIGLNLASMHGQGGTMIDEAIKKLEELKTRLQDVKGDVAKTSVAVNTFGSSKGLTSAFTETSNLIRAQKLINKENTDAAKAAEQAERQKLKVQQESERQAKRESDSFMRITELIRSMELAMKRYQAASNSMGNPESVERAIQKMREYIELAKQASQNSKSTSQFLNNASLGTSSNMENAVRTEIQLARQQEQNNAKAKAAADAQERLAQSHYKAATGAGAHINANLKLGKSLTGLISITGDLRNQLGMLVSAYTIEHMLKNVIEIGGEFEKQKLAMGAMLGSLEQADDIFNRMKNLALASPFNFKDLSNYSRQLTAYGTSYKDLYDTTNRLADISAGLGGDMSRLVLAFSQVKAAAYLRGQEMRQFTEFGVSLPDLLAKKYSEAEHRIVTAGDVIERVSKRMVSFNDVKDVLWKSTDKGGQFFGMQNVLAQSTAGMASNLKDAIDTMYYDIANSNSTVIKGMIKSVTELVSNWRELSSVLVSSMTVYSGYRIVMATHNRWIGLNNSSTIQSIMLQKQEEAAMLKKASTYRTLTDIEKERLIAKKQLTLSDLEQLAINRSLSAEQLVKLARTRQITAAQALEVSSLYGLNKAQISYLMSLQTSGVVMTRWQQLMNTQFVTRMRIGIQGLTSSIFTWTNAIMAGMGILITMYINYKQHQKEVQDANDQAIKNAQDGAKNLNQFLKENPLRLNVKSDDISKQVEQYKNQLESSPVDMGSVITNIGTLTDAKQQLIEMNKEVKALKDAHDAVSNSPTNPFVDAEESTNHWYNDSFSTNLNDAAKAWGKLNAQMGKTNASEISRFINSSSNKFPEIVSALNKIKDASPNEKMLEMFRMLNSNEKNSYSMSHGGFGVYMQGLEESYNKYIDYIDSMKTVDKQWANFSNEITNNLKNKKIDLQNLDQKGVYSIKEWASEYAKSHNLAGEALKIFNLKVEDTYFATDKSMKNSTNSWQLMFDTVKSKIKNGDIINASKQETEAAIRASISELRKLYPEMNNYLNWVQKQLNANPLIVTSRLNVMAGGTADNGWLSNLTESNLPKKFKGNSNLPKSGSTDINAYHSQLKQSYDTAFENVKLLKQAVNKAKPLTKEALQSKDALNKAQKELSEIIANANAIGFTDIINQTNNSKDKGTKSDELLKKWKSEEDEIKKIKDYYKKLIGNGHSETEAISMTGYSGLSLSKMIPSWVTDSATFDQWYKSLQTNLRDRINKSTKSNDRKELSNSISSSLLDFDEEIFKNKLNDMGKQIEKTLSDTIKNWDFYKKVKETTGNSKLAYQLAFGGVTQNKNVLEDIKGQYSNNELAKKSGIVFDKFVGMSDSELESSGLSSLKEFRDKYISENDKMKQETATNLFDLIQKNKDYAQQILDIRTKLAKDLADIEANRSDYQKGGVDVDKLKKDATDKANEKIGSLEFEQFKNTSDWVKIFDDLNRVSTATLDSMIAKLERYAATNKMSVQDTKELVEALKKIRNEEISRNPLKSAFSAANKYVYWKGIENKAKKNGGSTDAVVGYDESGKPITQKVTKEEAKDKAKEASDDFANSLRNAINEMQKWNNALSLFGQTVEALGGGEGFSDVAGVASGMLSGAASLSSFGPWGMAAGAAMGAITGIAELHDKKLDRAIQKSQLEVKKLSNIYSDIERQLKYTLNTNTMQIPSVENAKVEVQQLTGYINQIRSKGKLSKSDVQHLQTATAELEKQKEIVDAFNTGGVYGYQRYLYEQQLEELKKQRQAEEDKKNTDKSKIADYDEQIAEMESKITSYSEEMANSIYGIDLKGWASELGDALYQAWQKGEDGAEAFKMKSADIMGQVVNSWLKVNVLQPAMEDLQKYLFGDDGKGGAYGKDFSLDQSELQTVMKMLSATTEKTDEYTKLLDQIDAYAVANGMASMKSSTTSSLSSGIQAVTEQTADLLASYINAMRVDLSKQVMFVKTIMESIPKSESGVMNAQLQQLEVISFNMQRNADTVAEIKSIFNDVVTGNKKVFVK